MALLVLLLKGERMFYILLNLSLAVINLLCYIYAGQHWWSMFACGFGSGVVLSLILIEGEKYGKDKKECCRGGCC